MPARGGAPLDLNQRGRTAPRAAAQQGRAAESLIYIKSLSNALRYGHPDIESRDRAAATTTKENRMANVTRTPASPDLEELEDGIPIMQQILDNPFLLLFLGIAMPTVLYILWGVMEIVGIPVGK